MRICFEKIFLFKSYYVVWKPEDEINKEINKLKFKSYYVVWKLHMTENKNITQAKFKSYYVVWKLYVMRKELNFEKKV